MKWKNTHVIGTKSTARRSLSVRNASYYAQTEVESALGFIRTTIVVWVLLAACLRRPSPNEAGDVSSSSRGPAGGDTYPVSHFPLRSRVSLVLFTRRCSRAGGMEMWSLSGFDDIVKKNVITDSYVSFVLDQRLTESKESMDQTCGNNELPLPDWLRNLV